MTKLFNRITSAISILPALMWLGYYSLTKNQTEKQFYAMFSLFIMNTIKTGRFEGPQAYAGKRIYP